MRKYLVAALSVMLGISLVGCGGTASLPSGSPTSTEKAGPSDDAIKVDQIKYEVSAGVDSGTRRAMFEYSNESSYTVVGVKLELVPKEDAEDEQIKDAFDYLFESGLTVEDIRDGKMTCEQSFVVAPGGTSSGSTVNFAGYYVNKVEQYELMQPDMMTIQFLYEGLIYEEYYDYRNDSYSLSSQTVDPEQWGDSELSSAVPRPDSALVVGMNDGESQFSFSVQGMTSEAFKAYVDACKEAGFTEDVASTDTSYYADKEDELTHIDLIYWPQSGTLNAYVSPVEE